MKPSRRNQANTQARQVKLAGKAPTISRYAAKIRRQTTVVEQPREEER